MIETDRLLLREFDTSDAGKMYQLNLDPEVVRYTGDKPFSSVREARTFLENYEYDSALGIGRWAVILKSGQEFIGWCGLKRNEEGLIDIGFRFFQVHWNKGYASEAARATLRYGFLEKGIPRIIGRAAGENRASIRVLEKLGMVYWKEAACHGIPDASYYAMTREEFVLANEGS